MVELKESLSRVGADLKQKIVDSLKSTWKTINDFALAHRSTPEEVVDQEVDTVLSQMTMEEENKLETECKKEAKQCNKLETECKKEEKQCRIKMFYCQKDVSKIDEPHREY